MGNIYTAALMEHNAHPDYKYDLENATDEHEGVNPSCGDELVLKLRVENGVIEEAAFTGHGCAVSQASADMMADLVTGETVEEARRLCGLSRRSGRAREHLPHARPREVRRARLAHTIRDDRGLATVSPLGLLEAPSCQQAFFVKSY